jgi:hypothetical protein
MKNHNQVTKTAEIKVFLQFLLVDGRIRIRNTEVKGTSSIGNLCGSFVQKSRGTVVDA